MRKEVDRITELEERLDKVDAFYEALITEFMSLAPSEFKCSICLKLNLSNLCHGTDTCQILKENNK
jgi:hypothetical protein